VPDLLAATASAASEHSAVPANLPVSPGGRVVLKEEICWVPSFLRRCKTKGVYLAATGLTTPASRLGLLAREAPQPPPAGGVEIE
jgi:hypothetical protein